jgi:type II secretory pathway pseudopilin PulG
MSKFGAPVAIVIVVSVVASIIVPNVLTARNRSRQKRTMADMRTIATALEARATDLNSYTVNPAATRANAGKRVEEFGTLHRESFADLERALVPTYIEKLPRKDGWGVDFEIRTGDYNEKGQAMLYALRSYGSDRNPDGDAYEVRVNTAFREDLVYAQGTFVRYPEGLCGQ